MRTVCGCSIQTGVDVPAERAFPATRVSGSRTRKRDLTPFFGTKIARHFDRLRAEMLPDETRDPQTSQVLVKTENVDAGLPAH